MRTLVEKFKKPNNGGANHMVLMRTEESAGILMSETSIEIPPSTCAQMASSQGREKGGIACGGAQDSKEFAKW